MGEDLWKRRRQPSQTPSLQDTFARLDSDSDRQVLRLLCLDSPFCSFLETSLSSGPKRS